MKSLTVWHTKRYWALSETRTPNTLTLNPSQHEWPTLCTVSECLNRAEANRELTCYFPNVKSAHKASDRSSRNIRVPGCSIQFAGVRKPLLIWGRSNIRTFRFQKLNEPYLAELQINSTYQLSRSGTQLQYHMGCLRVLLMDHWNLYFFINNLQNVSDTILPILFADDTSLIISYDNKEAFMSEANKGLKVYSLV